HDGSAETLHDRFKGADLVEDGGGDIGAGQGHFEAAEVGAVGIAGMSSDADAARKGETGGTLHSGLVTGVGPAGDVGGCDVLHESGLVGGVGKLTHVAIEVDDHAATS